MYWTQEIDGARYTVYPSAIGQVESSSIDRVEEAEVVEECVMGIPTTALHIDPEIYKQLTSELLDAIEGRNYIKEKTIEISKDDVIYELTVTGIVYWTKYSAPDFEGRRVSDLVPVWWELHTYVGDEMVEQLNDASFDEIRKMI